MAWQHSAAMGPNGGGTSAGGDVHGSQSHTTEYTLQGQKATSAFMRMVEKDGVLLRSEP